MGGELDYGLIKELWAFTENRIAARFVCESHDADGQWWRSHGNENWLFDADGYMAERHASINDVRIPPSPNACFVGHRAVGRTTIRA